MSKTTTAAMPQHEVRVYETIASQPGRWWTNNEVADALTGVVAARTVRNHTSGLVRQGVVEVRYAFPGYRYRLVPADQLTPEAAKVAALLRQGRDIYASA